MTTCFLFSHLFLQVSVSQLQDSPCLSGGDGLAMSPPARSPPRHTAKPASLIIPFTRKRSRGIAHRYEQSLGGPGPSPGPADWKPGPHLPRGCQGAMRRVGKAPAQESTVCVEVAEPTFPQRCFLTGQFGIHPCSPQQDAWHAAGTQWRPLTGCRVYSRHSPWRPLARCSAYSRHSMEKKGSVRVGRAPACHEVKGAGERHEIHPRLR